MMLLSTTAEGQFYLTGEEPSGVKWSVIKSDNYKVIYPREDDSIAQRYLNLLELYRPYVMAGVLAEPRPIPVILHPFSVQSNGMVTWAPKRVELYTMPPANNGYPQNWDEQLILHESRHIGQMNAFTKGLFKPLNWLLGEQITGLGCGVYGSRWMFEGDAVVAETELSESGRGRSASFLEYYRASALSGEFRDWCKWRYGSNKKFTPSVYPLGYVMVSAGRGISGDYCYTGKILDYYVRHFYNPNVQNAAHKALTGYKMRHLAQVAFEYHTKWWAEDDANRGDFTLYDEFPVRKNGYYKKYGKQVVVGKDSIVAVKYSYDAPTSLVMLSSTGEFLKENPNGEKKLRPFSASTGNLQYAAGKIFYTESVEDERWGMASYNDLFSYEMDSGKITRCTKGKSYNNPALSITADSLSVIEYPYRGGSNLVVLDTDDPEKVLLSVPAPDGGQLTESVWMGNELYALAITGNGLGLFSLDISKLQEYSDGKEIPHLWKRVINEQQSIIQALGCSNDRLYFESDMDGVNNIYSFDPSNGHLSRLTNVRFAAHNPKIAQDKLYYTVLEVSGEYPVYTEVDVVSKERDLFFKNGEIKNRYEYQVANMLQSQAKEYFRNDSLLPDSSPDSFVRYESKPYRKLPHLFRVHSWAPVYYNVDKIMQMSFDHLYDAVSVGTTIYSQNTLGTAVGMLGYSYRKGFHAGHASFEYRGWYPVFKVEAHYNSESRMQYRVIDAGTVLVDMQDTGKPLFELIARSYLPLYFNSRGWQRGFIPQILWKYDNNLFYSQRKERYVKRHQLNYAVQYYQMRPVATAAIFPRWGVNVALSGALSPGGAENFGSVVAMNTYAYLPGIDLKHGLRIGIAYQKQMTDNKYFYLENLVGMPRGCETHYCDEFYKVSADYAVPINFTGLNLGFVGYFKRMQIIPFADYANLKSKNGVTHLTSFGTDLLMDGFLFKIGVPISIGVRYARTNDPGNENHCSLLFSTSMF